MLTFGLAKVVGGAISVHMFNLTEPAIRKIKVVNNSLDWFFDKKNKIKKVLTESPHFIATKNHINEIKRSIKTYLSQNEIVQKAKSLIKKKSASSEVQKIEVVQTLIITESTIVERISTKVESMSYSVSDLIDEKDSNKQ